MKCENCEYSYYENHGEDGCESMCRIFGYEPPDSLQRADGEGCICNRQTLSKFKRLNDESEKYIIKEYGDFYDRFRSER